MYPLVLEVGNTFLIISYYQAKYQNCLSFGAISHSDIVFFCITSKLSQFLDGYALCSISLLRHVQRSKYRVLAFPNIFRFYPNSCIKLFLTKIEKYFSKYGVILPQQGMPSSVRSRLLQILQHMWYYFLVGDIAKLAQKIFFLFSVLERERI